MPCPCWRAGGAEPCVSAHVDQATAETFSAEQSDECRWRLFEAFDDFLAPGEAAFVHPLCHLLAGVTELNGEVVDDQAFHPEPLRDEGQGVPDAARIVGVVFGNLSGDDEASIAAHVQDGGIERLAADIVEVDVIALGCCRLERCGEVATGPVVEGNVESDLLQVGAFGVRACEAHHRASR
jgi:hypothetical protein